jgi:triphosphoribosyl-dephospho-CoA synthetase
VTALAEQVAAAFKAACLDELEAPKPGNVHVFASGHRMTAAEFVRSAEGGEPELEAALARGTEPKWATLSVYLEFLSAFPDSHIARKHGIATAEDICRAALRYQQRMRSAENPALLLTDLLTWDALLKERGINPGTSADLTVATLFAHRLRTILPSARNND